MDYEVHMGGQKGKTNIFHVNMLKRWREASDTSFLVGCVNVKEEYGELPVLTWMKMTLQNWRWGSR